MVTIYIELQVAGENKKKERFFILFYLSFSISSFVFWVMANIPSISTKEVNMCEVLSR